MTPNFTVTRGNPTPEELAVAIAVLQAAATAAGAQAVEAATADVPRRHWAAPLRTHRASTHLRGGGMWALSHRIR